MSEDFVIESNIAPPPRKGRAGKWIDVIKKMNIGDSVVVPSYSDANALFVALKRNHFDCRMSKEATGIRVWKLEMNGKSKERN